MVSISADNAIQPQHRKSIGHAGTARDGSPQGFDELIESTSSTNPQPAGDMSAPRATDGKRNVAKALSLQSGQPAENAATAPNSTDPAPVAPSIVALSPEQPARPSQTTLTSVLPNVQADDSSNDPPGPDIAPSADVATSVPPVALALPSSGLPAAIALPHIPADQPVASTTATPPLAIASAATAVIGRLVGLDIARSTETTEATVASHSETEVTTTTVQADSVLSVVSPLIEESPRRTIPTTAFVKSLPGTFGKVTSARDGETNDAPELAGGLDAPFNGAAASQSDAPTATLSPVHQASAIQIKGDAVAKDRTPIAADDIRAVPDPDARIAAGNAVDTTPSARSVPGASIAQSAHTSVATALTVTQANAANSPVPVAVPLSGLAVNIAANVQSGRSRFDIRLDPAELGRIDVRIEVDKHGQVTSHLLVDKPETLTLLRQDATQLQRALDDAGLKTGDNGLQFSLRDQSSSGGGDRNGTPRHAQNFIIQDDDTTSTTTLGRIYGQMASVRGGVDIRI